MLVIPLFFACIAMAAPEGKPSDFRVWTSSTGETVTAQFVAIEGEIIVLKYEDGKDRKIPLGVLNQADQTLAKEFEKQLTGDAQTKGATPNLLPVFLTGDAKSYHAVYKHENFIAKVTNRGHLEIQCLEDGKAVGSPIRFRYSYYYRNIKRNQNIVRRIYKFDKFPAPTTTPTLLSYEATLDDEVMTGLNFAFIDNTIQFWGWVIDPPKLKEATIMPFGLSFTASHTFSPEETVAAQKEILKPYTLVLHQKDKKIVRFPYGDIVPRFPGSVQQTTIEGPLYGKRSVSVSVQSPKNTSLPLEIYRDFAPYQGYTVWFGKVNRASKSDTDRFILTID